MRIGFTGTVSIGKTTTLKALSQLPEYKDYFIATERSKYLRDLGIPLNTDSSLKGQIIFAAERASELFHENLLSDRTILDVMAFTQLSKSINATDKINFIKCVSGLVNEYDVIFYISPEGLPIEDNGVRETNPEYREQVNHAILDMLAAFPPKKLFYIHGSTEERIEQIQKHLTNLT